MDERLGWSTIETAARIREGAVSSREVVQLHIERIEAVNPRVNALVADRFEQALAEADAADGVPQEDRGPLHGVPCTIKEFFAVRGMPHTGGIRARSTVRADRDATAVQRVREAGAIVLGVTNAPEGGLWYETNNTIYGRTSNPWDLHRTPGGSSGGEGAIIAAGGSPFGLGSDTGGSIRIPSALCGIAGHKPTGGMVPATGHFPHAPAGDLAVMACGPMARDVNDLAPLLRILAGPDGSDPQTTGKWALGDPDAVDLTEVAVYPMPGNGRAIVRSAVRKAVVDAGSALEEAGASVRLMQAPDLARSFEVWAAVLTEMTDRYDEVVGGGERIRLAREILAYPLGASRHTASVLLILSLERALSWLPGSTAELAAVADRLRAHLETALGDDGVLLHPVVARTAPRHRGMLLMSPFDSGLTTAFNITTLPSTVVPIGLDAKGLPIGVQVVARRGNDHLTLAVASALQERFGKLGPVEPRFGKAAPLGLRLVRDVPRA